MVEFCVGCSQAESTFARVKLPTSLDRLPSLPVCNVKAKISKYQRYTVSLSASLFAAFHVCRTWGMYTYILSLRQYCGYYGYKNTDLVAYTHFICGYSSVSFLP